jgi:hypothetical protein
MRKFIAVMATAMAFSTASAEAHVVLFDNKASEATACQTVFTVKHYRDYATQVYKRSRVGSNAQHRMDLMHKCQHSYAARKAVGRWHTRYKRQREARACSNFNPVACIREASRRYGVAFSWLMSCANSEGGTSRTSYKRMNTEGSGAGGVFQFMLGTFRGTVRRMGLGWKESTVRKRWLTAKWNSRAAAWKFKHDGTGEWTGPGC